MATLYTDVATQQNDYLETTAERQSDGAKVSGDLLMATAKYTFDGTEADADVINIVKLPEGATVVPHLCRVYVDFDTGDETLDIIVGDDDATTAADDNRYCTTLVLDAAGTGVEAFDFADATAAAGLDEYKLQANSWIQATLSGEANTAADDAITFKIVYKAQS